MKYLVLLFALGISACTSVKLSVPLAFKDQAEAFHVKGARNNKMAYAGYHTSRIKRGLHVIYPGWSWSGLFDAESLVLNKIGIDKEVSVVKEKARFRYVLFEDDTKIEVYGQEKSSKRTTGFKFMHVPGPFNSFESQDEYNYIFSAVIKTDTAAVTGKWKLVMSNDWEREEDPVHSILSFLQSNDHGFATNTVDSIDSTRRINDTQLIDRKPGAIQITPLHLPSIIIPDTASTTLPPAKKPRGVKGITDSDYKIVPTSQDSLLPIKKGN